MRSFLAQLGATNPKGWQPVEAESQRHAAAQVAVKAGPGNHNVYVVLGPDRHPDGAPVTVRLYTCRVEAVPMPGDAVIVRSDWWGAKPGTIGIINGIVGQRRGEYFATFNLHSGHAFRGHSYGPPLLSGELPAGREIVEASGGPVPCIKVEELKPAGKVKVRFWRWKDRPRAGGGQDYDMEVPAWEWFPERSR